MLISDLFWKLMLLIFAIFNLTTQSLAQEVMYFEGDSIGQIAWKKNLFTIVQYKTAEGRVATDEGYIRSWDGKSLLIGKGFWSERILLDNIIKITIGKNASEVSEFQKRNMKLQSHKPILSTVQPNDRIRVSTPSSQLVGEFVRSDSLSLSLRFKDQIELTPIPISSIKKLERSIGHRTNIGKSAGKGFLVGASIGIVWGFLSGKDCSNSPGEICFSRSSSAVMGGILVGSIGGICGGIVGLTNKQEHWQEIHLESLNIGLIRTAKGHFSAMVMMNF